MYRSTKTPFHEYTTYPALRARAVATLACRNDLSALVTSHHYKVRLNSLYPARRHI